ncbi:MAG TPA: hypothetical protein DCP75_08150 [Haliea salexigens]|uniref:Uncharacterized protein n=1 Tax=Haliea salexigens TaxID=287487 RepID=A0A3C1KLZ0_9GAMM|nr:hypothetical protein [Haliea sp.]HAN27677.1 hypothetical protein [Haliea salexigens]|tara:strand:- start:792 stop:1022 length:231 start_codon:yes stop_codon:yes gene_type:complete
MGTVKRRSRQRLEDRDTITLAWDKGQPPPQEAFQPDKRDDLIDVVFFRWADTQNPALTQPYLRDWLEALRIGKAAA